MLRLLLLATRRSFQTPPPPSPVAAGARGRRSSPHLPRLPPPSPTSVHQPARDSPRGQRLKAPSLVCRRLQALRPRLFSAEGRASPRVVPPELLPAAGSARRSSCPRAASPPTESPSSIFRRPRAEPPVHRQGPVRRLTLRTPRRPRLFARGQKGRQARLRGLLGPLPGRLRRPPRLGTVGPQPSLRLPSKLQGPVRLVYAR